MDDNGTARRWSRGGGRGDWVFFVLDGPTDSEAVSGERVGGLSVLPDQRRVVALLARVAALAVTLARALADERRDDHLEALARGHALHARRRSPERETGEQQQRKRHRAHAGISRARSALGSFGVGKEMGGGKNKQTNHKTEKQNQNKSICFFSYNNIRSVK